MTQYAKAKGAVVAVTRDGRPVTDLPMFSASSGELNANSKKDALALGQRYMDMMKNGDVILVQEDQVGSMQASMSSADRIRLGNEVFMEAANDPSKWASLGSSIVARVEDRAERSGLMRNLLQGSTLRQGEIARVELKQHVCHAVVATGPSDLGYQILRGKVFNPQEFEVKSAVRVPVIDMHQIAGDLMGRAERDAHQSVVVKEDRLFMDAVYQAVGRGNPITYLHDKLLPGHLAAMRDQIDSWNIPVAGTVLSSDFWTDMIGGSVWMEALEPVTRYELLSTGRLATLLGMDLITDGFRDPTQRVLERGTLFTFATPEYLGAYTTRGGATSEATTGANEGNTDKGWLISEILSMVVANTQGLALAKRQ